MHYMHHVQYMYMVRVNLNKLLLQNTRSVRLFLAAAAADLGGNRVAVLRVFDNFGLDDFGRNVQL